MTLLEFKNYIESKTNAREIFEYKAKDYQSKKNSDRVPAKRWSPNRIEIEVNGMWNQAMTNTYNTLKSQKDSKTTLKAIVESDDFLQSLTEGIKEMDFNEE